MVEETLEAKLKRHEDALVACMAEIEKLRAENALLRSAEGAHDVLRRIYLNEAESSNARIKAAQASINYEKSRLENVPPALELTARKDEPLADMVHRRRRRADALQGEPLDSPKFLEWVEREDGTYPADDDTGS
jgi:hypothetical protein